MNATPTRSEQPSLREIRAELIDRPGLVGAALREALSDAYDAWLAALLPGQPGVALVAVGGLGRREPAPHSDLDLVLLHDGRVAGLAGIADAIWYPVWDSGVGLDHAVRTPEQALAVADTDLKALLGMLSVRHLAGDAGLTGRVRAGVLERWRATAVRRLPELDELACERRARAGEAAFLLEPNLKESRGGLRDGHALRALAAAQLADVPARARDAFDLLLDVRGELHRASGRADDVLRQEEHDSVAAALGVAPEGADEPRDVLLRRVNEAARAIAHATDTAMRRIASAQPRPTRLRLLGLSRNAPARVGLARDVVAQQGEVVLARDADPWADPGLVLRVARAAAEHDLPIGTFALERLAAESSRLPTPWPDAARDDFFALLGAGRPAITVFEALDEAGLLARIIPEWDAVRSRAQHNPVHRFTVDRHLLETAAAAAEHDGDVDRRDLLLLGALLHDIGKGFRGTGPGEDDHSVSGARRAEVVAQRIGLPPGDIEVVVALVRHHLLLPNTATRRDLDDPMTVRIVEQATGGSAELLDLLHALAVADAAATGAAAWSDWKAGLVADLVRRARQVRDGRLPPAPPALDDERRELAEQGRLAVVVRPDEVVVAAPDRPGTLYRTAGVLALHALDVRAASIGTHRGMAVNRFVVAARFGRMPDAALLRGDLARALDGQLPLDAKLAEKEHAYRRTDRASLRRPSVHWFDDSAQATVVEFRGADDIGLLTRVTRALEAAGLDVRSARISSTAGVAIDAFYVTGPGGGPVAGSARAKLTGNLEAAVRADAVPAEPG